MLRVIGCISQEHDIRLVLLAGLLCALACYTTLHMLSRAAASAGRLRAVWLGGAAVAFGTGVWTTHFIAMLAHQSGFQLGFAGGLTTASLLLPIGFALASFGLLFRDGGSQVAAFAAGLLIGAGIGAMHFTGMAALRVPARLHFDGTYVAAALVLGPLFAAAALLAFQRGHRPAATLLLCVGVCSLHFTAMAALAIEPIGGRMAPEPAVPPGLLAFTVAAGALLVIVLSLAGSLLDQRLAARAAQETERLRQFADSTFEGILFESGGRIADANAALACMLGCRADALVGQPLAAILGEETARALAEREAGENGSPIEAELRRSDGGRRPVEIRRRVIQEPQGGRVVLALRDLSERRHAEQRIQHLAHYDPLTGLANRLLFGDRLGQALAVASRSGQGVALLCLDLDRFKSVNDLLGHPAGDRLLAEAASRIRRTVRAMDTAARLGGDEFAVIQPLSVQPQSAAALAERLVEELGRPYEIDGQRTTIGASIGIAIYPQDGATAETLVQNADLALYRAKQDGRGVYRFFEKEMDRKLQHRRALERDLRDAVAREEMELHYQPLYDSQTLSLVGYEALLRWTHPRRGSVSPAEFIPVAEESGLIAPIGRWVLDRACAEAATWDPTLVVAVNLSPVQFRQADLAGMVAATLRRHGLDPARLELEITEGVLIDDSDRALAILRRLKELGVRIALDDFGTGYSSLSYLRRFPFDKIKIDRSFVQALGEDEEAEAIVSSIIAMGRSLRLKTTAEGVETEAQLARLREAQCGQVQGFLLGKPVPQPQPHSAPMGASSAA